MSHFKVASPADYGKAAQLLETIRSERPEYWQYGLTPDMFEPGDLFLINKEASSEPVGFVGWQERTIGGERVGMYAIGVLPEYRNAGIAKEAVSRVLCSRASGVDRVAAMVASGNVPSENLAASLGVPLLDKKAANPVVDWLLKKGLPMAGGALGNAALWDYTMSPYRKDGGLPGSGDWNSKRVGNTILNGALGATSMGTGLAGMQQWRTAATDVETAKAMGLLATSGKSFMSSPVKDLIIYAPEATKGLANTPGAVDRLSDTIERKGMGGGALGPILAGGGIAAALGLGAYGITRAMRERDQAGRLKVTLPTKNPGDSETVVDVPFNQTETLTPALRGRIEMDARRRLYAESRERIKHRQVGATPLLGLPPRPGMLPAAPTPEPYSQIQL